MSHIRNFKSFQNGKRRTEIIKESVLQVNDIYKVKSTIDIPQSLINAYVKNRDAILAAPEMAEVYDHSLNHVEKINF